MSIRLGAARNGDLSSRAEGDTILCARWEHIPLQARTAIEQSWYALSSDFAMQRGGHLFCLRCLEHPHEESYLKVDDWIADTTRTLLHVDGGDNLTLSDVLRCPQMLTVDNGGLGHIKCRVCEAKLTLFNPVIDLLETCAEVRKVIKFCSGIAGQPLSGEMEPTPRREFVAKARCVCGGNGLQKCGGCLTVRYCSQVCQAKHWKDHKKTCRYLRQAMPTGAPT